MIGAPVVNTVTQDGIQAKVKSVQYTFLNDGRTTICQITMENGFTVLGSSACVDARNFNTADGQKYSYENAFNKLWELECSLLREKLFKEGML
jgi:hypothetical protein